MVKCKNSPCVYQVVLQNPAGQNKYLNRSLSFFHFCQNETYDPLLHSNRLQMELQFEEMKCVLCKTVLLWLWLQWNFAAFLIQLYLLPYADLCLGIDLCWKCLVLESVHQKNFSVMPELSRYTIKCTFILIFFPLRNPSTFSEKEPYPLIDRCSTSFVTWMWKGIARWQLSLLLELDFKAYCLYSVHSPLSLLDQKLKRCLASE